MRIETALAALAALLLTGSGGAQVSAECRDDRGADRCAADQQKRVRDLFGVRSIEEHQAAGDQVRRVFYVDGYGRDLIAISFVRAPGRDPTAWLHFPTREGEPRVEPLQAAVPAAVWEEVIERSTLFDRALAPRPGDEPSICMHSWVYTIEGTDPKGAGRFAKPPPIRRTTADACTGELAGAYAREVPRLAIGLFPACAALDAGKHRNDASRLHACRILRGDRLAAAEVLNRAHAFSRVREPDDADKLDGLFGHEPVLDWNGERSEAHWEAAKNLWVAKVTAEPRPSFYFEFVEGESGQRVRLVGYLSRTIEVPDGPDPVYRARVEQIWTYDLDREFNVASIKVGPFERQPPAR